MKRDLQLAAIAALVAIVPGGLLAALGAPSSLAVIVSVGAGVAVVIALVRYWYRQIVARIDAQTVHLRSAIGVAATTGDIPTYWSDHAITPEALRLIQHLLDSLDARLVMELGSGVSTLLIAHAFRRKGDRKSTRLNSSHQIISYAVFCLKKKKMRDDKYSCDH